MRLRSKMARKRWECGRRPHPEYRPLRVQRIVEGYVVQYNRKPQRKAKSSWVAHRIGWQLFRRPAWLQSLKNRERQAWAQRIREGCGE